MKISTPLILGVLKVLTWIIFIGLCINTGVMIISTLVRLFNPEASADLYLGLDQSALYDAGVRNYIYVTSFMIVISALKAYMFYLVIKLFNTLNLEQPFSTRVGSLVMSISRVSLEIGIVAIIANAYAKTLFKRGVHFQYDGESTEFLFLAGVLFVIAHIFKRGLELQQENELTV